jgi:tetratricopeptide (TPR) repeat protein
MIDLRGEEMSQARTQHLKGVQLFRTGEYEEAVAALQTAQQLYQEEGDRQAVAEVLNDLGVVYRMKGDLPAAMQSLSQARELFAELGARKFEAQALGNLGNLHEAGKEMERAAALYKEAAALFQEAAEPQLAFETWRALSRLRLGQGQWLAALVAYDTALSCLPHPSLGQRLLRWLLRLPLKLAGG